MSQVSCRGLWKVFGAKAEALFRPEVDVPSGERIRQAGGFAAVQDVSLDVAEGEILVLMGLSGSGKSTLLRCLCRLIEPTAGEVRICGTDVLDAGAQDLIQLRRHRIGMVFQNFGLLPHRDVLGNVLLPLEVQQVPRAKAQDDARRVLELVGLSGRETRYPHQLSGGQQQRVGIARSLVANPDVWLLDEPFSALDPLIRREMQDEFLRLQRMLKKTIVFVTHDFDEAARVADRICIMRDGQVVQTAPISDLILTPADGYVQRFTEKALLSNVIRVGALVRPGGPGSIPVANAVPASALVADVASEVLGASGSVAVVSDNGKALGMLDRDRFIDVLANRKPQAPVEGARS